jgi:hypothetical protein
MPTVCLVVMLFPDSDQSYPKNSAIISNLHRHSVLRKRYSYPCNRPWRPIGLWDVEAPTFSRLRLMDGGEVSLKRRPHFAPRKFPCIHFCYRLSWPQGRSAGGRIRSIEKSSDLIGNRINDLPACSVVPQPTTLPRYGTSVFINFLTSVKLVSFLCFHS